MKLSEILPLFEYRKNPHLNPKYTAFEQLHIFIDEYFKENPNANPEDLYISFTNINKIGLNPLYSYEITPAGIYAFNLEQMYQEFKIGKHKSFNRSPLPSTVKGRKYIQVLKYNHKGGKFLDLSKYSEIDLKQDIAKIKKLIPNDRFTFNDLNYFDQFILETIADTQPAQFDFKPSAARKLFSICKALTYQKPKKIIKKSEPSKKDIPHYQTFETIDVSTASINWNWLLRKLGYEVLDDPAGSTHANEYIQTVFLTSKSFDHIKTLTNVDDLNMDELELEILQKNVNGIVKLLTGKYQPSLLKKFPQLLELEIPIRNSQQFIALKNSLGITLDMYHNFNSNLKKYNNEYIEYAMNKNIDFFNYSNDVANALLKSLYENYFEAFTNNPNTAKELYTKKVKEIISKNPKWLSFFKQSSYFPKG